MIFDGADEKLEKICNSFQENDQRFKIYKQKQSGVSSARNLGILNSRGNYITFVDADDLLYSKDTLEVELVQVVR